jgi:hypothetical protein
MPGFVPGIHVYGGSTKKDVDGRDELGHDAECCPITETRKFSDILTVEYD